MAAAVMRAHAVLADQRVFALDPVAFAAFESALERPVARNPGLEAPFARKSVFKE